MTTPSIVAANNPCALRPLSRGRWKGQTGTIQTKGGAYCAFSSALWGVRAGLRNLATYRRVHGLVTPAQIIGRWAPQSDNNPETAYAGFIARRVGVPVNAPIPDDYEHHRRLVSAIIRFETGSHSVSPDVIAQAMALIAGEERAAGRDPSAWEASDDPMKPLTRSREIAVGGGAASVGVGGAIYYGREAVEVAREAVGVGGKAASAARDSIGSVCTTADIAAIGSFALLILFGLAIVGNRLWARWRARR